MIKTLTIALIISGLIIFFLILALIGQLDDSCEYEKKIKRARAFINKYWVSYKDICEHNKEEELDIPLEDIKELYEILGDDNGL